MLSDREYLNFERRHLAQTTRALKTVLDSETFNQRPLMNFYRAVVAYLAFNVRRLCLQDKTLADLVAQRFDKPDPVLRETLAAVYGRLENHRKNIATLLTGMAEFERTGPKGQKTFENAARAYLDARERNRGSHTLTTWRDQVIVEADWGTIAARTDAEVEAEKALFDTVEAFMPEGLDQALAAAKS